jgi:hypothetical protein
MRFITRIFKDWLDDPLSPSVQGPTGLQRDQGFEPEPDGFWATLLGRGSDGRLYEVSPSDRKRLQRPVILRDPRAVRNEEIAAAARQRRARDGDLIIIGVDREYEPGLPQAEILPPAPRPVPAWIEVDNIVMPSGGPKDGGHGR